MRSKGLKKLKEGLACNMRLNLIILACIIKRERRRIFPDESHIHWIDKETKEALDTLK